MSEKTMSLRTILFRAAATLTLVLTIGCGDGASDEEIQECHSACDVQLTKTCYNADLHQECYDRCSDAMAEDAVAFAACVRGAATCDVGCRVRLR